MSAIQYNKLVRDRIPEIVEADGIWYTAPNRIIVNEFVRFAWS